MLRALQNQRRRSADDGFTLIELLIVIIILGVLAAIVVFSVRGVTNNSKKVACQAEVETVQTAIEADFASNGAYPATVHGLVTDGFLHSDPSGASHIAAADAISATGQLPAASIVCP
ncbi:hypothetical protein GCM10028801_17170 [Nocardioides maradonensis]